MYARALQHVSLAAVLASPHPTIDLQLDAYELSSQLFLDAVIKYTTRAVEEMSRRRDADASRTQKDAERQKAIEYEIADCKEKEVQVLQGTSCVCKPGHDLFDSVGARADRT